MFSLSRSFRSWLLCHVLRSQITFVPDVLAACICRYLKTANASPTTHTLHASNRSFPPHQRLELTLSCECEWASQRNLVFTEPIVCLGEVDENVTVLREPIKNFDRQVSSQKCKNFAFFSLFRLLFIFIDSNVAIIYSKLLTFEAKKPLPFSSRFSRFSFPPYPAFSLFLCRPGSALFISIDDEARPPARPSCIGIYWS